MNTELLEALNILEKEKDISKETILDAIENSLLNACKNHFGKADNIKLIMDREDYIDEAYIMEVSSPGLGRPLKKEKDFKRSLGEEVEIRTYRMVDKKKEFTGILKSYDEKTVTIELDDTTEKTFEKGDIALIRLAFDF